MKTFYIFFFFQMSMMAMGAAGISSIIAIGALAYALSLEARILALASVQSDLDTEQTNICTAVRAFSALTRTAANGGAAGANAAGNRINDADCAADNSVECRNQAFLTAFTAVAAPTCS